MIKRTDKTEEGTLELDKGLKFTAQDERNQKANALDAPGETGHGQGRN
jgi:hypothetical protein